MNYEDYFAMFLAYGKIEQFKKVVTSNFYRNNAYHNGYHAHLDHINLQQSSVHIVCHTEFRGEHEEDFAYYMPWDVAFDSDKMKNWIVAFNEEKKRKQREKEEQERRSEQERIEAENRLAEREADARKQAAIRAFLVEKFGEEQADKLINGEMIDTNDGVDGPGED